MQASGIEERGINSATSSPKNTQKPNTIFGLLSKRSTKVEPHPSKDFHTDSIAAAVAGSVRSISAHDTSFARCSPERQSTSKSKSKSQTLPANGNVALSGLGLSGIQRKLISPSNKSSAHSKTDGYLSDSGTTDVILRHPKANKHRSPNHNRFSHQFSLCCKSEKKPATPPVTVRYSSIVDDAFSVSSNQRLKDDALSLSCSAVEHNSLSSETNSMIVNKVVSSECASAPQSPVAAKSIYASPSKSSTQSSSPLSSGPIRPLEVSACRSRLRLKLYPAGYALQSVDATVKPSTSKDSQVDLKRASTPQHNSSPNIPTQAEMDISALLKDAETIRQQNQHAAVRFRSHDNLQRQSSSSGLARQALMAAQMLSLIPTDQTRER